MIKLKARVSSSDVAAARQVLLDFTKGGTVSDSGGELLVQASLRGESARDLNRSLLTALRRAEKSTRLRAEWTSADGTVERFFDYVPKRTKGAPAGQARGT